MNVVQFQDWEYQHHEPLAGTVENPSDSWLEIGNRKNFKSTVQNYIRLAKSYNMKTLSYNLLYGALENADKDGVKNEWYMYKEKHHSIKEVLGMQKPPFKSDIFFTDPSNKGWQNYIGSKTKEAFEVYAFDGFQVDQVGNRDKNLYTYDGTLIDLPKTYKSFLESMKLQMPDKNLVMNAVNQYGQENSISKSPVDFLYTEVWAPDEGYKDLARIIQNNDLWSNYLKKSVLCAYMNYNIAENPGYFNMPGVLLTNAVIFSFGGAHLELGEHMLGKEYFPNDNLKMRDDLKKAMIVYYDFLTGYENLLRDGGSFNSAYVTCTNGKMNIGLWPPQNGKVSVQGKKVGVRQIFHFINFANASSFEWRDANGTQAEPKQIISADLEINYSGIASKIWVASPDINYGIPQSLSFTQAGNTLKFSLPSLKYWDMIVIE
jgi:dextranase